jgi:hypothetical protein
MHGVANLPVEQRAELFRETGGRLGLAPARVSTMTPTPSFMLREPTKATSSTSSSSSKMARISP